MNDFHAGPAEDDAEDGTASHVYLNHPRVLIYNSWALRLLGMPY